MSKIILLLFGIAFLAIVQGLPHSKPCNGGGGGYRQPYYQQPQPYPYPYPYPPPPPTAAPATSTAAPVTTTAAPAQAMQGPPLTPEQEAMLSSLYAMYVASKTPA